MMKKIFYLFLLQAFLLNTYSQHMPVGINYQAVARDKAGNEIKSKNLNVRISILRGDATGHTEYAETHSVTTDPFGLFNITIGEGSYYAGEKSEFVNIDWGSSPHFLKIEIDFGEGFIGMGTMQFLAVPYALYAATAGSAGGEEDRDKDPQNEIQILSLEGSVLQIKQGSTVTNSVTLSDVVNDADHDPENERQDLNLSLEHKLKITNNPAATILDLTPYLDNTDNQSLSRTGNSLSVSGGNTVVTDNDTTNEIQDINLNGYNLSLSKGKTVNLRPEIIAFRAFRDKGKVLMNNGDSVFLDFKVPELNMGNAFNNTNGMFTVPAGGEGLYSFSVTYDFIPSHSLRIFKNGDKQEVIFGWSPTYFADVRTFNFIYYLQAGDNIQLSLKTLDDSLVSHRAIFSGYRIH